MKRNSMVFFRSFRESLRELPPELYREVSEMIFDYALDGIEPTADASPIAKAFFASWRGSVDTANNRYDRCVENGKKGGAPKGSRNNPNGRRGNRRTNQETNQLTNQELTVNKEYGIMNNEDKEDIERKDTPKVCPKENPVKPNFQKPPFDVIEKYLCDKFRWKPEEVRMFYEHCEANGWTTESGNPIKSWKATAQNWKDKKDRAELKSQGWDY